MLFAIEEAKKCGVKVVDLTGELPSKMDELCDFLIKVPSARTTIIQESHIMIGHIICALTEKSFIQNK